MPYTPHQLGYRYAKSQRERKSMRDHPVPSLQAVLTYVKNYSILLDRRKAAVSRGAGYWRPPQIPQRSDLFEDLPGTGQT